MHFVERFDEKDENVKYKGREKMNHKSIDIFQLDEIIKNTIQSIQEGKKQIFEISEGVREEYQTIEAQLQQIKNRTKEIISKVDELEKMDKIARQELMRVSRHFGEHSEQYIHAAYMKAQNTRLELVVMNEKEYQLRKDRDELEQRLCRLKDMMEKADGLTSKVGMAIELLSGNLNNFSVQLENFQQRQQLAMGVIKAQEDERKRIAREVHDGPAQSMANVVIRAEICEKLLDSDVEMTREELKRLKVMVRDSLKDVRRIIFDLRPMTLDDLGIVPALERIVDHFIKNTGVDTRFVVLGGASRVNPGVEVTVFRLVQEALNNVEKHAQAEHVKIKMEFNKDKIGIVIEDDGKGFDEKEIKDKINTKEHYGLLGMKERLNLLNGTCNINSIIGRGTKLMVSIPLHQDKEVIKWNP